MAKALLTLAILNLLPKFIGTTRIFLFTFLSLAIFQSAISQSINHWETIIYNDDTWSYHVPTAEPDSNWATLGYDDSAWPTGPGGFGYGDADDNTTVSQTISVYIRHEFNIVDTSKIAALALHADLSLIHI